MDHNPTEHTISTEYELTWEPTAPVDELQRTKTMIFTGPGAEEDAYDVAELLAATDGPWTMRTRTVDTAITPAPWINVAAYVVLDSPMPAEYGSGHDVARLADVEADEPLGNVHGRYGTA